MRYFQKFNDEPDMGTLLREDGSRVEVLGRNTLEWTDTPQYSQVWNMTQDWDEVTAEEAARIESVQRAAGGRSPS